MAQNIDAQAEIAVEALRINPQGELEAKVSGAWVSARELEGTLRRSSASNLERLNPSPVYTATVVDRRTELTAQVITIPAPSLSPRWRKTLDEYLVDREAYKAALVLESFGANPRVLALSPDALIEPLSTMVLQAAQAEHVDRPEVVAARFAARLAYEVEIPQLNSPLKGQTLIDIAKTGGPFSVLVLTSPQDRLQIALLTAAAVVFLPPLATAGRVMARWVDVRLSSILGVRPQLDEAAEPKKH